MKKGKFFFLGILCVFLFFSCKNSSEDKKHTDTVTSGVIGISADESFAPVVQQELDVFESIYTMAGIVPFYVNEVDAVNLLLRDSVRFAITTRRLTETERNYLESRKFFPKEIKIATDGIAVIVNNQNPDSLISIPELREIMTGRVTNWKELNSSSSLDKLQLVFDNPNSSTVRFAIDSICRGEQLSGNLNAQKNNPAVIDFVAQTPGAIGIIGASWIGNKQDSTRLSFIENIKVMSISREKKATLANSYKPYQAYLALGNYPLTREVYILLTDPRSGLASGLTSFISSDRGQRILLKAGILPATQTVRIVNVRDDL